MGAWVASQMIKAMLRRRIQVEGARVLILGLAFKENCPDLRNTRVIDVVRELAEYGVAVDVHDPWVNPQEAAHEYGIALQDTPAPGAYDGVICAVAHDAFVDGGPEAIRRYGRDPHVFFDLKSRFAPSDSDLRL